MSRPSNPSVEASPARVSLAHGSGGEETLSFLEERFRPHLSEGLADTAVVEVNAREIAISTNTFVVTPQEFPGGNIGSLAVNGTLNDLCTAGASPSHLSIGFVLEEGLPFDVLDRVVDSVGGAARRAGILLVAGDTKVVERGRADRVFINTTGVGILDRGFRPAMERTAPGDAVVVTGPVGRHAAAVLVARGEVEWDGDGPGPTTDSENLFPLLERMRNASGCEIHALRDPTAGGVAASLGDIARSAGVGIDIDVDRIPVTPEVEAVARAVGIEPLHLCSAGTLVVIVPAECADEILPHLHDHPLGRDATVVGTVSSEHPGEVVAHDPGEAPSALRPLADDRFVRIC